MRLLEVAWQSMILAPAMAPGQFLLLLVGAAGLLYIGWTRHWSALLLASVAFATVVVYLGEQSRRALEAAPLPDQLFGQAAIFGFRVWTTILIVVAALIGWRRSHKLGIARKDSE